jgi:RNA polymerase sigma-70 factor (ECF subfamily)
MSATHPQTETLEELDEPLDTPAPDSDQDAWDAESGQATATLNTTDPLEADSLPTLITKVMHQDEQALASLYARLGGAVFSLALQITRNTASAEEVLQDVFWQIWRQAPRFDSTRGSVPAWVLTIARSRSLDAVRSHMRTPQSQAQASETLDHCIASEDAGPHDLLFAAQQGSALQAALEKLDPLRRQLVSLSFYRGLTQQEIAEQTGMPLGTVKSHLRRSLLTLRESLGTDVAPEMQ